MTASAVQQMIKEHNEDEGAHGALMGKMEDALKVNGLLKGDGKGTVSAAKAGADYQQATKSLKNSVEMALEDTIPFYSAAGKENRRVSLQVMKDALGVQSPTINVITCAGAAVTCVKGSTTLNSEGPGVISLPGIGTWTVTATLGGKSVSKQVEVTGAMQYTADLMITSNVAITSMPTKTTYRVGEAFDSTGLVVTAKAKVHDQALEYLKQGYYLIALMKKGTWTGGGHFVVVWWADDKIRINDPASTRDKRLNGDPATFRNEAAYYWVVDAREYNNGTIKQEDEDMDQEKFNKMFATAMQQYRQELRDNDSGEWSRAARQFAIDQGIFAGSGTVPDGTPNFMWEDFLTREQCAQVLYRFAQKYGLE